MQEIKVVIWGMQLHIPASKYLILMFQIHYGHQYICWRCAVDKNVLVFLLIFILYFSSPAILKDAIEKCKLKITSL